MFLSEIILCLLEFDDELLSISVMFLFPFGGFLQPRSHILQFDVRAACVMFPTFRVTTRKVIADGGWAGAVGV